MSNDAFFVISVGIIGISTIIWIAILNKKNQLDETIKELDESLNGLKEKILIKIADIKRYMKYLEEIDPSISNRIYFQFLRDDLKR